MSHILTCLALRALSRKGTVASCRQEAKISMAIVFCRCIQQGVVRSHRNESWDLTRDSLPRRSKVACSLFEELISNVQTILLSDFKNNSIEAWKDFMYIHLYRVRQELVFIMLKSIISLKTQRLQSIQLLKNTMYGIALMILDHPLMSMMRWRSCFFRWRWAPNSSKKTFPLNIPCLTYDLEVTHRKLVYRYTSYESLENNIQNLTTRKCRTSKNQYIYIYMYVESTGSSNICILTKEITGGNHSQSSITVHLHSPKLT